MSLQHRSLGSRLWLPRLPLRPLLLSTTLFDELTIGLFVVGLPLIRDRLHLTYLQAGLLFTAGGISAIIVEPLFALPSDRWSKRWLVLSGMLVLVGGYSLAGVAPGYGWLLLAIVLIYPAIGAASGLAQAALIDLDPAAAAPMMVRWTMFGGVGDLLCPAAFGLLNAAGVGWLALCLLCAGCWLVLFTAVAPLPFPAPATAAAGDDDAQPGVFAALRVAARDPQMLRWVAIELAATTLDEVFLGFAALYLHDHLHVSAAAAGLALLPAAIAALLSLVCLERVLQRTPGVRLLPALTLLALTGVLVLLLAPNLWIACAGLVLADAGAAGWYPIARAAAYDRYPGRPGLVHVVMQLPASLELAFPGLAGFVAAGAGIHAAMLLFLLAPICVLLLTLRAQR